MKDSQDNELYVGAELKGNFGASATVKSIDDDGVCIIEKCGGDMFSLEPKRTYKLDTKTMANSLWVVDNKKDSPLQDFIQGMRS